MSDEVKMIRREGNYTQMPNELTEFLMEKDLTGLEFRICLFMIRNLTGWNYEFKPVSAFDIENGIKFQDEKQIMKALSSLVKTKKVLLKKKVLGFRTPLYSFNKEEIGRCLIGNKRKYYLEDGKVIDLESFKLLKVRNLTPSECQSLHLEGVHFDTSNSPKAATGKDLRAPKYPEIHLNTHLGGESKNLTKEKAFEILLKKYPNDAKCLKVTYAQIEREGYLNGRDKPFSPNHLPAFFLARWESLRTEYKHNQARQA